MEYHNKGFILQTQKAMLVYNKSYVGFVMEHESLKKAIEKMGSQTALGKAVGKSQAHVWAWLNRDKRAPAEQVIAIEKATGVPRYELRPDIYPPEEYRKAS